MEDNFAQRYPVIFNRGNEATKKDVFNRFINQVKGEIEAWLQRGSDWVIGGLLVAFVNIARHIPFRRGS